MTNEEFQILVISELKDLKKDVGSLKQDVSGLKQDVSGLKNDVNSLKDGQIRIESKLDAVYDQTAVLTEFRTEINMKIDNLIEDNKSIHEMLGEHEVSIRTLRRKPV